MNIKQLEMLDKLREELEKVPTEGFFVRDSASGSHRPFGRREWEALGATPEQLEAFPKEST